MGRMIQEKSSGIHCQIMAKASHISLSSQQCYHGKYPESPRSRQPCTSALSANATTENIPRDPALATELVARITHSFSSFPWPTLFIECRQALLEKYIGHGVDVGIVNHLALYLFFS